MGRIYWPCLIFGLLLESPAFGQYAAVIQACSRDLVDFCGPNRPEGSRLAKCTEVHFLDFTEPCKAALVKIAAVREACGEDIQKQCSGIKPSAGRILLCVKDHFGSLSEQCKTAIGHAAERKVRHIEQKIFGPMTISNVWFGFAEFIHEFC